MTCRKYLRWSVPPAQLHEPGHGLLALLLAPPIRPGLATLASQVRILDISALKSHHTCPLVTAILAECSTLQDVTFNLGAILEPAQSLQLLLNLKNKPIQHLKLDLLSRDDGGCIAGVLSKVIGEMDSLRSLSLSIVLNSQVAGIEQGPIKIQRLQELHLRLETGMDGPGPGGDEKLAWIAQSLFPDLRHLELLLTGASPRVTREGILQAVTLAAPTLRSLTVIAEHLNRFNYFLDDLVLIAPHLNRISLDVRSASPAIFAHLPLVEEIAIYHWRYVETPPAEIEELIAGLIHHKEHEGSLLRLKRIMLDGKIPDRELLSVCRRTGMELRVRHYNAWVSEFILF